MHNRDEAMDRLLAAAKVVCDHRAEIEEMRLAEDDADEIDHQECLLVLDEYAMREVWKEFPENQGDVCPDAEWVLYLCKRAANAAAVCPTNL